jgi:heme-degrading monooxygenase HmoA
MMPLVVPLAVRCGLTPSHALPILGYRCTRYSVTAVRATERGQKMHARVAFYRLKTGTLEHVVRTVEAPGGMLEIFRGRPGFQSYELIETGAGLVSVSHWESSAQADAATHAAAAWVADHIDDLVKLQQSDTGEVVLSSLPAAATR